MCLAIAHSVQIAEVVGEEELVIELSGRAGSNGQEPREVGPASTAGTLCNVGGYRDGAPLQLVRQAEAFGRRKTAGAGVNREGEGVRLRSNIELAVVLHGQ